MKWRWILLPVLAVMAGCDLSPVEVRDATPATTTSAPGEIITIDLIRRELTGTEACWPWGKRGDPPGCVQYTHFTWSTDDFLRVHTTYEKPEYATSAACKILVNRVWPKIQIWLRSGEVAAYGVRGRWPECMS